ncbi:hypothetical protein LDENG_00246900, partial [Lucifuga dentata]
IRTYWPSGDPRRRQKWQDRGYGHQRPLHRPGLHGLHVQVRLHPRRVEAQRGEG